MISKASAFMHAALCTPPPSSAFCVFHQILPRRRSFVCLSIQFSCHNSKNSEFCVFYNILQHQIASAASPSSIGMVWIFLLTSLPTTVDWTNQNKYMRRGRPSGNHDALVWRMSGELVCCLSLKDSPHVQPPLWSLGPTQRKRSTTKK